MLLQGALCQESEPHRVLSDGWSISDTCHSHLCLQFFLEMPMKRMLDEAPMERPHPSPFLRSWGLAFGNSLECWAWAGSRAAGLASPEFLDGRKRHLGARGRGECWPVFWMLQTQMNSSTKDNPQWLWPSREHHSYILVSVHSHFVIVMCLSSGCHNKVPKTGWLINNRNFFSGLPWSSG